MAKFFFKLQPLLNVKQQMEDNLKNELGKALRQLEKEKAILAGIKEEKCQCIAEFNEKAGKGISVKTLIDYNTYISYLSERIHFQKEKVKLANDNVDKIREELLRIVKEKEILEKLKEKKFEEFLKEQLREEQKINDEIVSYKYAGNA
ncbi:MAG TPA: flagellar export protein FliJ [Clostridiaceae bacterium]|nr:flagellar export protein FliJ [Clostridiaceae bacterium]